MAWSGARCTNTRTLLLVSLGMLSMICAELLLLVDLALSARSAQDLRGEPYSYCRDSVIRGVQTGFVVEDPQLGGPKPYCKLAPAYTSMVGCGAVGGRQATQQVQEWYGWCYLGARQKSSKELIGSSRV